MEITHFFTLYTVPVGEFIIFLSLRFYVKSFLGILEMQNLPFDTLEALNMEFYEFLYFLEDDNYQFN